MVDWEKFALRQGRYVILGSIDGILAVLGVVLGVSVATEDVRIIVSAGFGAATALALTNGLGSYLAESAVEYGKLARVEDAMLTSLRDTQLEAETTRAILLDSLTHGGFSFLGAVVPLLPYAGATFGAPLVEAVSYSIVTLFALGLFSGAVSRKNWIASGVKMVALGLLVALVTRGLGGI